MNCGVCEKPIDEHEAGRETDACVAEAVMGWMKGMGEGVFVESPMGRVHLTKAPWSIGTSFKKADDIRTIGGLLLQASRFELWQPSTNIADAWRVVEKMLASKYFVEMTMSEGLESATGRKDCMFTFGLGDFVFDGESQYTPLAICHAALKATAKESE